MTEDDADVVVVVTKGAPDDDEVVVVVAVVVEAKEAVVDPDCSDVTAALVLDGTYNRKGKSNNYIRAFIQARFISKCSLKHHTQW